MAESNELFTDREPTGWILGCKVNDRPWVIVKMKKKRLFIKLRGK